MSFLNKLLGQKPKPKKAANLPEAIKQMKETEETLLKKQTYLEEKIKKEIAVAKKNASTNKKAAILAIQRKKRLEKQLQQVDGALTTLETQREVLEGANINTLAVSSMEKASKALKATHKGIDVDKVEQILDDLADQRDVSDAIADAISQPVGLEENFDEEELERELQELEGLEDLSLDNVLPTVPQESVRKEGKKKEKVEALVA